MVRKKLSTLLTFYCPNFAFLQYSFWGLRIWFVRTRTMPTLRLGTLLLQSDHLSIIHVLFFRVCRFSYSYYVTSLLTLTLATMFQLIGRRPQDMNTEDPDHSRILHSMQRLARTVPKRYFVVQFIPHLPSFRLFFFSWCELFLTWLLRSIFPPPACFSPSRLILLLFFSCSFKMLRRIQISMG